MSKVGIQLENTILTLESTDTFRSVLDKLEEFGMENYDPVDEKPESKYYYTKYLCSPLSEGIKWNSVTVWIDNKAYVLQFRFDGMLKTIAIMLDTPGDLNKTDNLMLINDAETIALNEIIIQMRIIDVTKYYQENLLINIDIQSKISINFY